MSEKTSVEYWLREWRVPHLVERIAEHDISEAGSFIRDVNAQHRADPPAENEARGFARFICHLPEKPSTPAHLVQSGAPSIGQAPVPWPLEPDPPPPAPAQPRTHWRWIDAAILAAILLLFGAKLAHCQFYGPLTVQSNGSTVALFSSVGRLNFTGSGTPCTASGITVTCDLASSSAGVTSVGLTMPAQFTVTGSPVTSTGTLAASWATVAANLTFAGPASGAAAAPTFRALVGADLPAPSASTLGGVESIAAVAHTWLDSISTLGVPHASQPSFADILSTAADAQLADAYSGVGACASHQWASTLTRDASPTCTQPGFADVSGSVAAAQMPALSGDVTTTAGSTVTTVGKVNGVAVTGTPTSGQVITATSGTAADWATPSGGGATVYKLDLSGQSAAVPETTIFTPATSGYYVCSGIEIETTAGSSGTLPYGYLDYTDGDSSTAQSAPIMSGPGTSNVVGSYSNQYTSVTTGVGYYFKGGDAVQFHTTSPGPGIVFTIHVRCEQQ